MNTLQRITITLPSHTYEQLTRNIPRGKISKFVAQALSDKLSTDATKDAIDNFIALQKKMKKLPPVKTEDILKAIHRGRE